MTKDPKMQESRSDDALLPWHLVTHNAQYPCFCIVPSHIDSELGHVTFLDQWDISKCDSSKAFDKHLYNEDCFPGTLPPTL